MQQQAKKACRLFVATLITTGLAEPDLRFGARAGRPHSPEVPAQAVWKPVAAGVGGFGP
jgi:hypothetical protein